MGTDLEELSIEDILNLEDDDNGILRDKDGVCLLCNGQGNAKNPDGKCKCGAVYVACSAVQDVEATPAELESLGIPYGEFRGNWDSKILLEDNLSLVDNDFRTYLSKMDKLYNIYDMGGLPNVSTFTVSDMRLGKTTWAQACIKRAFEHGHSVLPILDTLQVKLLLTNSWNGYKGVDMINSVTYEKLVSCEVFFMAVSRGQDRFFSFEIIDQVLYARGRSGLTTHIISNSALEELSLHDKKGTQTLARLICNNDNVDRKRYPVFNCYKGGYSLQ